MGRLLFHMPRRHLLSWHGGAEAEERKWARIDDWTLTVGCPSVSLSFLICQLGLMMHSVKSAFERHKRGMANSDAHRARALEGVHLVPVRQ